MLGKVVCMVAGHRVNRRRVRYNGLTFTCRCSRCGTGLEREARGWTAATRLA